MNNILQTQQTSSFLNNQWYVASSSKDIKKNKVVSKILLGKPILIGRNKFGRIFAINDNCPHRGTLLSIGRFDGENIECPYHGWRFDTSGQCTFIPSQLPKQKPQAADIKTKSYSIKENMGIIWIYISNDNNINPFPSIEHTENKLQLYVKKIFDCNIDLAVTGLMDPAHGAFVHASSLWRTHRDVKEKKKIIKPIKNGWEIQPHSTSINSKAYKIFLGKESQTKISYTLPGIRQEFTKTNKYSYLGITACTPINESQTTVHHFMYWDVPGGIVLRNIIRIIANNFLNQDSLAVTWMKKGKVYSNREILVEDADIQIKWYYKLKKEWQKSCIENREFSNPIQETIAKWKS